MTKNPYKHDIQAGFILISAVAIANAIVALLAR